MKKFFILTTLLIFLISCVTGPADYSDPQSVIDTWARGLREKDLNTLMSTYWHDAEAVIKGPDGQEQTYSGWKEIKKLQRGTTENPDLDLNIWLHVAELKVRGDNATCTIKVEAGDFTVINVLELKKQDGRWGIIRQVMK